MTFIFGSYLPRAETLIFEEKESLKKIDTLKQVGYLVGMVLISIFYFVLESSFDIVDKKEQIFYLHILLLILQIAIISIFIKSYMIQKEES